MKKLYVFCFFWMCGFALLHAQVPGNSLAFDGTGDYVSLAIPPALTNLASTDFSVETWVMPKTTGGTTRVFFAQSTTTDFVSILLNGSNVPYFYMYTSNGSYSINPNISLPLNQWSHLAVTWDAQTAAMRTYINGQLTPVTGGGSSSTGANGILALGSRTDGMQNLNGELDEFRVWNFTRSDCEILSNVNSQMTGVEPGLVLNYDFNQGVAGGNNVGVTALPDITGNFNGTLNNFTLSGTSSNWVSSGIVLNQVGETPGIVTNSNATICQGDSLLIHGTYRLQAGIYEDTLTSVTGCDSIARVDLAVNPTAQNTISANACNTYNFQGNTLTQSGTYSDTLQAINGCDSIITLNLVILGTSASSFSVDACDMYDFNGTLLTQSGTYTDTLQAVNGCDSIVSLTLVIDTLDLSVSVTLNNTGLLANQANATYQWIDCGNGNAVIPGAVNQSFSPAQNGSYAVIITNNSCADTSACTSVSGLSTENQAWANLKIFPNPVSEVLQLEWDAAWIPSEISIWDIQGRKLASYSGNLIAQTIPVSSYTPGLYNVRIVFPEGVITQSFIKK